MSHPSSAAASTSAVSMPSGTTNSIGAGQDFVLFDDGRAQGHQSTALSPTSNMQQYPATMAINPSMTMTGIPSYDSKPSFTEYRASQIGHQTESPFSSPASKAGDDFGTDDNHFRIGDSSGTLAHGTPKSKRQRGHGYSSSWNGGNLLQQRHLTQNRQASGGTLANAMAPIQPYGAYQNSGDMTGDWSGSDSSPHNPPSGSLGPPIHSLSLGDGSDGMMTSLFPNPTSFGQTASSQSSGSVSTLEAALQASTPRPSTLTPQQQQDERSRQQIRAELMGVDSRALKGPLRDIQQGSGQDANSGQFADLNYNTFGSGNFFPAVQNTTMNIGRPYGPIRQRSGSLDENFLSSAMMTGNVGSSFSGWNDPSTTNINAFNLQGLEQYRGPQQDQALQQQQHYSLQQQQQQQQQLLQHPYQQPSQQRQLQQYQQVPSSSFPPSNARPDLPSSQFSSRTQQAVDRARAQKPTRKRISRDQSGLTVSPQEAFLDYHNIESLLQASRAPSQGLPSTAQNLFAAPPPGISESFGSESAAHTPKAAAREFPVAYGPSTLLASMHESTPSLVDASSSSSSNDSRANSSLSSPPHRMPLNREDTVRPAKAKAVLAAQHNGQNPGDGFFSPAYSTSSSTDDEDEKPYISANNKQGKFNVQFPFPPQSASLPQSSSTTNSRVANTGGPAGQHHSSHHNQHHQQHHQAPFPHLPGPRFSVVSSSSSESDDDDQRGRMAKHVPLNQQGRRTMGGYGYMGSSEESGLSINPSFYPTESPQQNPQQQSAMNASHSFKVPSSSQNQLPGQTSNHSSSSSSSIGGAMRTTRPGGGQSDSQSQDDDPSISPSIRSSAQPIFPTTDSNRSEKQAGVQSHLHEAQAQAGQRSRSRNRAQIASAAPNRRSSEAAASSLDEASEWETGEDSEADGSDYRDVKRGAGATAASSGPRKSTSTKKRRRGDVSTRHGGANTGGDATYRSHNAGATSGTHLTICDYISPLSGESCRTEFHRPYDLARHRETIHAREEALLLRQGRLKKDQCVVLYKEVDPEKSLATVEWKCEGKNGCGSLFSRKDALLRHKRIRGH
ncbi:hypothetical protein CBS101457_004610 [Exobasidium rhododendri]|nr:hypothetical protein CBS101457_004610 [Exobasidium rhododendri]